MENNHQHSIPYCIKALDISNFNGIDHTTLDLSNEADAQWIFLTGENGFGKTTVLQALAIGLYGYEDHTFNIYKKRPQIKIKLKTPDSVEEQQPELEGQSFTHIACYGSSRLNIDVYQNKNRLKDSPTIGLFDTTTVLRNIESELSRWYFKQEDREFKEKYSNVSSLIKKLLPHLKQIKIDKKTDKVTYIERDDAKNAYHPVPYEHLAAGFRSVITMVGDMILRFFNSHQNVFNPSDFEGIVIIDELDLHFHPIIQRELPSLLSSIFPKIQFIASTHSPIPILGAPKNSIFLKVERTTEHGIYLKHLDNIKIRNLTPNTILSSPIFGFTAILPKTHHYSQRVHTELTYDELKINDIIEKRLDSFAKETEGEFDGLFEK